MPEAYRFVRCPSADCGLRFPGEVGIACPLCQTPTLLASGRCAVPDLKTSGPAPPLQILLDNVRSVFNVGSIFRSADGVGATHVYLGGITPSPEHKAMHKTALGAEELIPWTTHVDSARLAEELASAGHVLWALERTRGSLDLFESAPKRPPGNLILVFGNEVTGVDPGVLQFCKRSVHIPMRGSKTSLNVATAMGIAAYVLSKP